MLIRSIINGDVQTFQEEFEARMAEKLAEAINVLSIVEAKKLLLGKEKDEDGEDDEDVNEEDLEEAQLLLKQNKRARNADRALQKGAIRGEPTSNLKGYRAKTKYHNLDTVNRFRKKSGQEPLGKQSKYRDKINALKARNPKRLPEEDSE